VGGVVIVPDKYWNVTTFDGGKTQLVKIQNNNHHVKIFQTASLNIQTQIHQKFKVRLYTTTGIECTSIRETMTNRSIFKLHN
jgi:hypothetical protein